MSRILNVALDGPSGVGKSSAADIVAEKYGLTHIDTGAMYRAAALYFDTLGIAPEESEDLLQALENLHIEQQQSTVLLNGKDVSEEIRTPKVSMLASQYSQLAPVRRKLVALQQQMAKKQPCILDGRDICDVVLPNAQVKVYLDASTEARAMRRHLQNLEKGMESDYAKVCEDIEKRDLQDRTRAVSPLTVSKDAVIIDTSDLTLKQTAEKISDLIDQSLKKG
jgi:cytidylate kinase